MSRARDTADQINRINSSAADATAITVDSSENVGIGTNTPVALSNQKSLTINGTSVARLDLQGTGQLYANSTEIVLQGSYGKTVAIDGGTNKHISFRYATAEKMRLDSDGLKFNGDTAAANALNDYEEGTWSPVLGGGTTTGTQSGTVTGFYRKIGTIVHCHINFSQWSNSGMSGNMMLYGLPFTVANNTSSAGSGSVVYIEGAVFNATSSTNHTNIRLAPLGANTSARLRPENTGTGYDKYILGVTLGSIGMYGGMYLTYFSA